MSGIFPELPTAIQHEAQGEAPETQYLATGLLIQDLLKSVKGFQASLEVLSAKVYGNGDLTFNDELLQLYISLIRT